MYNFEPRHGAEDGSRCRLRKRSSSGARCRVPAQRRTDARLRSLLSGRRGPWPTLLMRQPYGRDIASTVVYAHPVWFARHGYHVAIQDVRGRGGSEGEFYPFRNEGARRRRDDCVAARRIRHRMGASACTASPTRARRNCWRQRSSRRACVHRSAHDGGGSLSRLVLSSRRAAACSSSLGWGIQMLREDARRKGCATPSDRLEAAWANIRSQAAHVPYATHPAIVDSGAAQLCARLVYASRARRVLDVDRTSARESIGFRFPRCTSRAGSTRILKARSPAILRCATVREQSSRARINI